MKVVKTLKVSPEEFFTLIENSLRYDIEQYGRKAAGEYVLEEGLVYYKKIKYKKKEYRTRTEVKNFQAPWAYQVLIKNEMGNFVISYDISQKEDNVIEVVYQENTVDENGNPNTSLGRRIFGKLQAGRIKHRFSYMENNIHEQRKKNE